MTAPESWPEPARERIAEIGGVDVLIGLPTFGPTPGLATVGAAIRAGSESAFAGRAVAAVHVDDFATDERRWEQRATAAEAALRDAYDLTAQLLPVYEHTEAILIIRKRLAEHLDRQGPSDG